MPRDGTDHPTAYCDHCSHPLRYWGGGSTPDGKRYPWGWICASWWWMEGGCPHPTNQEALDAIYYMQFQNELSPQP